MINDDIGALKREAGESLRLAICLDFAEADNELFGDIPMHSNFIL